MYTDADKSYTKLGEGTVRIWDVNKKYTMKHYDFLAWKDRGNWSQVPYGTTDYTFKGDCVLEGKNFWISLHSNERDSVFLYAKTDAKGADSPRETQSGALHSDFLSANTDTEDAPSRHNEIYRTYDADVALSEWNGPDAKYGWNQHPTRPLRCYGNGSTSEHILKNEPDEILVESTSMPHRRAGFPEGFSVEMKTTYRILGGMQWVEIKPVQQQASEQGMHGETRMLIVPDGAFHGRDYVIDSLKHQGGGKGCEAHGIWLPDNSKMLLDLAMDIDTIWLMTWPNPLKARPYGINCCGGWKAGWQHIVGDSCSKIISSPFARFGEDKEPVIIGVLYKNYWHYQRVKERVTEGQVFEGTWKRAYSRNLPHGEYPVGSPWEPGYPGLWRIIGCIDGEYFTNEVTISGKPTSGFSFASPATGILEYLITYLYERTEETPLNVSTPMDIYREAIEENRKET